MYAEFKDSQCKEPFLLNDQDVEQPYPKVFTPCGTHGGTGDPGLSMLEFLIGERLEEAVEAAQAAPVQPIHQYALPEVTIANDGSLMQSMGKISNPAAVRLREKIDPLTIRTTNMASRAPVLRTDIEGSPEDADITDNLDELFGAVGGEVAEG
jgi:hypothetical protein